MPDQQQLVSVNAPRKKLTLRQVGQLECASPPASLLAGQRKARGSVQQQMRTRTATTVSGRCRRPQWLRESHVSYRFSDGLSGALRVIATHFSSRAPGLPASLEALACKRNSAVRPFVLSAPAVACWRCAALLPIRVHGNRTRNALPLQGMLRFGRVGCLTGTPAPPGQTITARQALAAPYPQLTSCMFMRTGQVYTIRGAPGQANRSGPSI